MVSRVNFGSCFCYLISLPSYVLLLNQISFKHCDCTRYITTSPGNSEITDKREIE